MKVNLGILKTLSRRAISKVTGHERPSWSLLTLHKAGSAYVANMVGRIFIANGYEKIDLCNAAFRQGIGEVDYVVSHKSEMTGQGRLFGPFRADTAALVGLIDGIRPIVHVRDVRDCIVSNFFSIAYSHRLPGEGKLREKFIEDRQRMQEGSIERYIEEVMEADSAFARIGVLRQICEKRPDAVLSRYEEMVTDFPRWLIGLLAVLELTIPKKLRDELLKNAEFDVSEDKFRHKRQVVPGDFRRKLAPEMQVRLTEKYRKELEYFGYSV